MYQVAVCVLIALSACGLCGCRPPVRKAAPIAAEPADADWHKELAPGRSVEQALGYLLSHGYECRVARDEKSQVERILATPHGSPHGPRQQIEIAIEADNIENARLVPQ